MTEQPENGGNPSLVGFGGGEMARAGEGRWEGRVWTGESEEHLDDVADVEDVDAEAIDKRR